MPGNDTLKRPVSHTLGETTQADLPAQAERGPGSARPPAACPPDLMPSHHRPTQQPAAAAASLAGLDAARLGE